MAGRSKKQYESKAVTTSMRITSRASVKVGESFYTVEYCEERLIPQDADVNKERELLWQVCNEECDKQIEDILKVYKK